MQAFEVNHMEPLGLYGSSILPALIPIGIKQVQLGDVVRRAQKDSGLCAEHWNKLQPVERDLLLVAVCHALIREAAIFTA
jgi:hypothetical protein